MKKWICLFLVMMLTVTGVSALADARMPALRGALTDEADVLSGTMSTAITEYADTVDDETDMDLYVVFVHFLDGLDAQTYDGMSITISHAIEVEESYVTALPFETTYCYDPTIAAGTDDPAETVRFHRSW